MMPAIPTRACLLRRTGRGGRVEPRSHALPGTRQGGAYDDVSHDVRS